MIERLAVIGVGLIGGSLARALRAAGEVDEIIGCGRSAANLERAVELGVIDRFAHDPAQAVQGADMVFIAVPLGAMRDTFAAVKGRLRDDAVITDGGSVKGSVAADARAAFGHIPPRLVPGHPIAGTEYSGVEASFPELFRNRRVILTPLAETDPDALDRVIRMWRNCGAQVSEIAATQHDRILAAVSHLPQLLASSLVDSLAQLPENDEVFRYAGTGFRDFSRIASGNPIMWRDICIANREQLEKRLRWFSRELLDLAAAVRDGDGDRLLEHLQRAKATRDGYIDGVGTVGETDE